MSEQPAKIWSSRFRKLQRGMTVTAMFFSAGLAFAAPIKILVLDAHSGRPVRNTDVSVAILGEKNANSYKTGADGKITLDLNPAAKLIPSTGWRVTCRKLNPTNPHWFSAETIIEQGVVDENTCGKAHSETIKGTLTIFTRKSTFFENMAR